MSFDTVIFSAQSIAYSQTDSRIVQLVTIPEGKDKKQYMRVSVILFE